MGYVIVDLEFNNLGGITKYYPDFYENNKQLQNIDFDNEIIEIGAVKYDKLMNEIGSFKAYIKPVVFTKMNPKIIEITHITDNTLESGQSFLEAMTAFMNFLDKDDILCSWAKDDVAEIIKNARYHSYNIEKYLDKYIDLQEYCTKMLAKKKSLSLKNAMEELKISVANDKLHDALYDAICTGKVFKRLYNYRSIKNYIIDDVYNAHVFAVKALSNRMINMDKVSMKCPHCGCTLELHHDFKLLNWRFASVCTCPKCKSKVLKEVTVKESLKGEELYKEIDTILDEQQFIEYKYKIEKDDKKDSINICESK